MLKNICHINLIFIVHCTLALELHSEFEIWVLPMSILYFLCSILFLRKFNVKIFEINDKNY